MAPWLCFDGFTKRKIRRCLSTKANKGKLFWAQAQKYLIWFQSISTLCFYEFKTGYLFNGQNFQAQSCLGTSQNSEGNNYA